MKIQFFQVFDKRKKKSFRPVSGNRIKSLLLILAAQFASSQCINGTKSYPIYKAGAQLVTESFSMITYQPAETALHKIEVIVYEFVEGYSAARYGLLIVHD